MFLFAALLTGCGLLGSRNVDREDPLPGEVTPSSSGVYTDDTYLYVELRSQEESGDGVAPSDHPADISAEQVEASLAALEVAPEEGGEPISLIPAKQLPELSVLVAQALGDAASDEDAVFHVFRTAGPWFGSGRRVTTARVFYRDGALNLIFGELDDFYSEHIDRNLQPLKPGYRNKTTELSGSVVDSPQVAFVDNRDDWIRLDPSATVATEPVAPGAAAVAPTAPAPVTAPVQTTRDPRWTQLEERLLILDGLRQKGLITEEDYETKKQELLEVLDL